MTWWMPGSPLDDHRKLFQKVCADRTRMCAAIKDAIAELLSAHHLDEYGNCVLCWPGGGKGLCTVMLVADDLKKAWKEASS